MTENSYMTILEDLPENWFTHEELRVHINKAFIDHIRFIARDFDIEVQREADIARLYELLAEDSKTSVDEIEESMYQAAHFVARLTIFNQKFPHIVTEFPVNKSGQSVFPTKILAKILDVDEQEADIIAKNYWGSESNGSIVH